MTTLSFEEALRMPAGELAEHSSEELYHVRMDALEAVAAARDCANHVDRALELKYGGLAQARRFSLGKDTGVVHLDDGPVRITADLPKRVEWDQRQLAEVVERIRASGASPDEFVTVKYSIDERRFASWPTSLRTTFEPARTLRIGRPSFRLVLRDADGANDRPR